LDVQTVLGLAAGIPTSFLSVGGVIEDADFPAGLLATTDFLSTTESPPSVFTTSASNDEAQFSPQDLQYVLLAKLTRSFLSDVRHSQKDLQWIHGRRCSRHLCDLLIW
jgi:hypothetical protein